ncbi:hypothetical protein GCM10009789_48240 [Kribbella sancticallisti]|uniref:Uncharacterized protein n=1 Tax=Kribbella sancticallisti TaxID=460087 RepID=A0ABN2DWJ8_9ACTN
MRNVFVLALALGYPLLAIWQIQARKLRDRLDLLIVLAAGVLFLLFARATTDWQAVPPWIWLIGLVLLAVATALAGWAWPALRWIGSGRPRLRTTSVAVQLVIAAVLVAVLV